MFNSPSPTNAATPPVGGPMPISSEMGHLNHPQSLPATPTATNVRTFTDFSGEHTRLTTLHGSTGALEVNNLGGFKLGPMPHPMNGSVERKYTLESSIDGMVHGNGTSMNEPGYTVTNSMGMNSHMTSGRTEYAPPTFSKPNSEGSLLSNGPIPRPFNDMHPTPHSAGPLGPTSGNFCFNADYDDEISDVFSGLSFKEPTLVAAPGFGRSRLRRSSAPVVSNGFGGSGATNGYGLWSSSLSDQPLPEGPEDEGTGLTVPRTNSGTFQSSSNNSSGSSNGSYNGGWGNVAPNGLGGMANIPQAPPNTTMQQQQHQQQLTSSVWFGGNSDSVTSGYSSSEASSLSGFSPIYSPTASNGFGFTPISRNSPTSSTGFGVFVPSSRNSPVTMVPSTSANLFSNTGFIEERDAIRSPFKVCVSYVCVGVCGGGG